MAVPTQLREDVKRYCGVTWTDAITDGEFEDLIEDGEAYIDGKLGTEGDYESPGYPRTLLKEYVRYARDYALDVFENNYRSLILAMQHERSVDQYVESSAETA